MSRPNLHVVVGPTASGKTATAINLAKHVDGEVVSADSMQVYKHMNIGTAKPTKMEMDGVPHHLLDVADPIDSFSVAEYTTLAGEAIQNILARGKTPILTGGTGFYINAVIYGTAFSCMTKNGQHEKENQLREVYIKLAQEKGAEFLHSKLLAADPDYANSLHPNNIKKVARALSFCETTGGLFSAHNKKQKQVGAKFNVNLQLMNVPRDELYARINARVLGMWEAGLPDEVKHLLSIGCRPNHQSMQGIGYKEMVPYIDGIQTKEETIAKIQQATRNYAKRQDTWFRHQLRSQ